MLGEQIGEEKGKVTLQRVLDTPEDGDGANPKIESTFSSNRKFKGYILERPKTRWDVIW